MFKSDFFFDIKNTIAKGIFEQVDFPWEAIPLINGFILKIGKELSGDKFNKIGEDVWVAKTAKVYNSAHINGPAIICDRAVIRQCAFIRGNAIIGDGAVVGNSTELKNVILFDEVQTPHYNYIGDSILGYRAHFGAGAITSNVKADKTFVSININGEKIQTGLKKIGAIVGDYVEVGCNSVLNPGTIIGKNSMIYPLSSVRGYVPADSIYKASDNILKKS